MAVGTSGSPLCAELNRLANGGTYPLRTAFKDEQGAANAWAGLTGDAVRGIVGALNYKVSTSRTPAAFKDIDGVCNELAGTTGLAAPEALRRISS
jgi:hypothetical protein